MTATISTRIMPMLWFDNEAEEAARVHNAVMQMTKLDLAELRRAYAG